MWLLIGNTSFNTKIHLCLLVLYVLNLNYIRRSFLPCSSHHVRDNQAQNVAMQNFVHRRNPIRRAFATPLNINGGRSLSQNSVRQSMRNFICGQFQSYPAKMYHFFISY